MNLPSDYQRLLPFVVVALLGIVGLLLVVRGVGGGGGGTADAQQLIRTAFEKNPKSGVVDLRAVFTAELATGGGEPKVETNTVRANGPFVEPTSSDPFALGEVDARIQETGDGKPATVRVVSSKERGYIQVSGQWYELTKGQARRVFNDKETGRHKPVLQDEEFNVRDWIQDPKRDGTVRLDGVQTDRVVGAVNVDAMLADLELTESDASQTFLQSATKQGEAELYIGKDDGLLRKVSVTGQAAAQGPGGSARFTIRFDLALTEVNKPQQISAPEKALDPSALKRVPASALGSQADAIRGKKSKGGDGRGGGSQGGRDGGASSGTKRSSQAYVSCVQQATDTVALEKCQALLP